MDRLWIKVDKGGQYLQYCKLFSTSLLRQITQTQCSTEESDKSHTPPSLDIEIEVSLNLGQSTSMCKEKFLCGAM